MTFHDFLLKLMPLNKERKKQLALVQPFLTNEELAKVKRLLKKNQIYIYPRPYGLSSFLKVNLSIPAISPLLSNHNASSSHSSYQEKPVQTTLPLKDSSRPASFKSSSLSSGRRTGLEATGKEKSEKHSIAKKSENARKQEVSHTNSAKLKKHPEAKEQGSIHSKSQEEYEELMSFVNFLNQKIERRFRKRAFEVFSKHASVLIPKLIAPNILGYDDVKKVLSVQLFSKERIHSLLLGDPSTGKTELIRSAYSISPIGSYGLGSGVSKAGLSLSVIGNRVVKGLLPLANGGVCAIDELNLIKKEDLGALYNAMEKGFVSYDKGDMHKTVGADVRIMATANPKSNTFASRNIHLLRAQIPFDSALMSRFHYVILLFKPDEATFVKIASSMLQNSKLELKEKDIEFIKDFVSYALDIKVDFPHVLDDYVKAFARELKQKEDLMIVDASPRHIVGIIRTAKALARMQLSRKVSDDNLKEAIDLFRRVMFLRRK